MNALQLLDDARRAGLAIWCEGKDLRFKGSRAAVTTLVPALREHKAEVLAYLHAVNDTPPLPCPGSAKELQADYWPYLDRKQRYELAECRQRDPSLHELLRLVAFAVQGDSPAIVSNTLLGVSILWRGDEWDDQNQLMRFWHGRALEKWRLSND